MMSIALHQVILDKYRIVGEAGAGGMARVWRAEEVRVGNRQVALKEPRDDLPAADRAEVEQRFLLEVDVCAALEKMRVTQVVRAITVESYEGKLLLALEYMAGGNLEQRIRREKQGLPLQDVIAIARDLLSGLAAVHAHPLGIVHRDIKPSNVLFDGQGRAHLGDFGLAQVAGRSGRSRLQGGSQPGTPLYMAPEQASNNDYLLPAADLFAVGCVIFEMLTGKACKRVRPGTPPSALRADAPGWLDALVLRAMLEDPYDRYEDGGEMLAALAAGEGGARAAALPQQVALQQGVPQPVAPGADPQLAELVRRAEEAERALATEREAAAAKRKAAEEDAARVAAEAAAKRKAEEEAAALRARIEAAERERAALRAKEEAARLGLPPGLVELGLELVKIPAGEFLYGEGKEKRRTGEYWLGKTPVTVGQFGAFVKATGYETVAEKAGSGWGWTVTGWKEVQGADWQHPRGPGSDVRGKEGHPVTLVSWEDAQAFCRWAGVRLPSEEEWEKGARGTDGRAYPWGNEKPDAQRCNFGGIVNDTTPVGQYPKGASPYGLLDMAGNVWEWCEDAWEGESARRVVRGGSWSANEDDVRAASRRRNLTDVRNVIQGFRVALSPQL